MAADDVPTMLVLLDRTRKCHRTNIIFALQSRSVERNGLENIFQVSWKLGIVDAIIVAADLFICRVFTYIPFKVHGKCHDTSPVLLASCQGNSTCRLRGFNYFQEHKRSNLHLCKLVFEFRVARNEKFNVRTAVLKSFLQAAMNATAEVLSSPHLALPEIRDNSTNIILGQFYVSEDRLKIFVIPSHLEQLHVVVAVPHREVPNVPIQWFRLFEELSFGVWYGMGISFLATVVILCAFLRSKKDLGFIVLFTLRTLLGFPNPSSNLPSHTRVFLSTWLMACLVLNSTYLSTLLRKLTYQFSEEVIKTIADLLQSDLMIHFASEYASYAIKVSFINEEMRPFLRKVRVIDKSYEDVVDINRTDVAYLTVRDDFGILFSNMTYRYLEEDVFVFTRAMILMPRPTPYEHSFQMAVLRIAEAGAFAYIDKLNRGTKLFFLESRRRLEKGDHRPLTMKALAPVFVLWFTGSGMSFMVFVIEKLNVHMQSCYSNMMQFFYRKKYGSFVL